MLFATLFPFFDSKEVLVIPLEEKNLILALKQNDRSAINTIFLKYHVVLCRISFRIINDEDEAKDAVQEVFIKLWQKRRDLTIDFSLEAYLKRAVINSSLNHLERMRRVTSLNAPQNSFSQASENTVDQQQSYNELSVRIDYAIGKLPQRTQLVFKLIRFEEMSYKEVSEGLEISIKAVEKEMMKALRLLREALKDYLPLLIYPIFLAL